MRNPHYMAFETTRCILFFSEFCSHTDVDNMFIRTTYFRPRARRYLIVFGSIVNLLHGLPTEPRAREPMDGFCRIGQHDRFDSIKNC